MMHDFHLHETILFFLDLPAVFDMEEAMSGGIPN
ncbi:MAG: hypothetical protein Ct9H90mP5_11300 [Acidimicrobiaceae bacterium]|nr:MAG: hypothetical protein Ct9H90mP5_11300 [Acidimicrobiaceae bacterium]